MTSSKNPTAKNHPLTNDDEEIEEAVRTTLDIVTALSIPGLSDVLEPLTVILEALEPDPLKTIQNGIDEANQKLNQMYSVILNAIDRNDIKDAVTDAYIGLRDLKNELDIIEREGRKKVDAKETRKKFDVTRGRFSFCLAQVPSYLDTYADSQSGKDISLGKLIGGFNFAIEQLQEAYTILVEATRSVKDFYSKHPEYCDKVSWNVFTEYVDESLKEESDDYYKLVKGSKPEEPPEPTKALEQYYPKSIAPIMKGGKFNIKLAESSQIYWYHSEEKEKSDSECDSIEYRPMETENERFGFSFQDIGKDKKADEDSREDYEDEEKYPTYWYMKTVKGSVISMSDKEYKTEDTAFKEYHRILLANAKSFCLAAHGGNRWRIMVRANGTLFFETDYEGQAFHIRKARYRYNYLAVEKGNTDDSEWIVGSAP